MARSEISIKQFELYSRNFLFEELWALLLMVFAFALARRKPWGMWSAALSSTLARGRGYL